MKTPLQTPRRPFGPAFLLILLCLLLPAVLGGCPEFGNDLVNAVDTFTRSVLNAVLDIFFDQFRGSGT